MSARSPEAKAQGSEGRDRPRILVVDDERGPRESLRMVLSGRCDVSLARSGAEALLRLRAEPFDLVTLDLHMPGIQGRELMPILRDEFPGVAVIVITGCGSVASASEGIRCGVADYLQKPFDVVELRAAVERALARKRARALLADCVEQLGGSAGARGAESDSQRSLAFLHRLSETLEVRDPHMLGHTRRVAFFAELLAHRLGVSAEEHAVLRSAAFVHDLGNVGIAPELLARPDALEADERLAIEDHAAIGEQLLQSLELPRAVCAAVRHHHEWWDGSGAPDELSGTRIPLSARILAVADAFDAMNSGRPHREALPREVVQLELRRGAGRQFDPDLVKEFLTILETGVCELDPEWVADAVTQATALDRPRPIC